MMLIGLPRCGMEHTEMSSGGRNVCAAGVEVGGVDLVGELTRGHLPFAYGILDATVNKFLSVWFPSYCPIYYI